MQHSKLALSPWGFAPLLLAALLNPGMAVAHAGDGATEIRWNELAALIVGRRVSIPIAGAAVQGDVLSVRDGELLLEIRKSTDARLYAKGQASIPRASITEIRIVDRRGAGGRILGSVVGALVGIVAGVEIAVHAANSEASGVAVFTTTSVACTVGGYYAGRLADRHYRLLRIAPSAEARE